MPFVVVVLVYLQDFHFSDDLTRDTNPFVISISTAGTTFVDSFEGVNVAGTAIGLGEDFDFPTGSTGRYVRLTGVLAVDQWLSINEVRRIGGGRFFLLLCIC